jgi:hypothetical protein
MPNGTPRYGWQDVPDFLAKSLHNSDLHHNDSPGTRTAPGPLEVRNEKKLSELLTLSSLDGHKKADSASEAILILTCLTVALSRGIYALPSSPRMMS